MIREKSLSKPIDRELGVVEPWNSFRDMERMFRDFFVSPMSTLMAPGRWETEISAMAPEVDLCETEKEIVLSAALPGINIVDIDIDVTKDSISVSGVRRPTEEKPGEKIHIRRQHFGTFRFSYALPTEIKPGEVAATYKDGILEIAMPKAEVTQAVKVKVET